MRVLIYGAGAIGCYLGGHLALAGHEITLLGRESLAQAVGSHGLSLRLQDGTRIVKNNIRATTLLSDALTSGPFEWIAFTMKAYDTVTAIHELQSSLNAVPTVACFQNGVGNEESLRAAFGADKIVAATVMTPVSIPEPGVVVEEKRRGIAIATDTPSFALPYSAFENSPVLVSRVSSAPSLKWSKLTLNMLANAVPAIVDWTPRAVYDHPRLFWLELAALREAISVAELQGIQLVNLPGVPARTLATIARWMPGFLLRPLLARRVAGGRGDKQPSLRLALQAGNKQTEIAWLNGAVAQAARALDRYAPINHALALTLSDISSGRETWESYRNNPDKLLRAVSVADGMKGWGYGE